MNNPRKIILIIYFILVTIATVYVPWRFVTEGKEFSINYYTLIWSPLSPAVVDFQRVVLELISITAMAGIALLLGDPKFRKKYKIGISQYPINSSEINNGEFTKED